MADGASGGSIAQIRLLGGVSAKLLVLRNADQLQAFDNGQLDALALLLLDVHRFGYLLGLAFFSLNLVILGFLLYRSGFLPKTLGVLSVLAAAG